MGLLLACRALLLRLVAGMPFAPLAFPVRAHPHTSPYARPWQDLISTDLTSVGTSAATSWLGLAAVVHTMAGFCAILCGCSLATRRQEQPESEASNGLRPAEQTLSQQAQPVDPVTAAAPSTSAIGQAVSASGVQEAGAEHGMRGSADPFSPNAAVTAASVALTVAGSGTLQQQEPGHAAASPPVAQQPSLSSTGQPPLGATAAAGSTGLHAQALISSAATVGASSATPGAHGGEPGPTTGLAAAELEVRHTRPAHLATSLMAELQRLQALHKGVSLGQWLHSPY